MSDEQNSPFKKWTLHTADGRPVVDVELPVYLNTPGPQLVIWGERFFIFDQNDSTYKETLGMFAVVPGNEMIMEQEPPEDEQNKIRPNGFDYGKKLPDGQYEKHPTIEADGRKFVRPIRRSYYHAKCGKPTVCPKNIAETIALDPSFYGSMFCAGCKKYLPTGESSELVWLDENNKPTDQKVGA